MSMTRSERIVLSIITAKGNVLSGELANLTQLAPRTVNFATRRLLLKGLIKKMPNLLDMRTVIYSPVTFSQPQTAIKTQLASC